jgi:membrane protease YdiL (CAAX protease family)
MALTAGLLGRWSQPRQRERGKKNVVAIIAITCGVAGGLAGYSRLGAAPLIVATALLAATSRQLVVVAPGLLAPLGLCVGFPWPSSVFIAMAWLIVREWHYDPARGIRLAATAPALNLVGTRRPPLHWLAVGTASGLVAASFASALAATQMRGHYYLIAHQTPPAWMIIIGIIVLAAVNATLEELLWRGWWMTVLDSQHHTAWTIILVQALSFGAAHAGGMPHGLLGMAAATALATWLGFQRKSSGSLIPGVFAHLIVDVALFWQLNQHLAWHQ